MKAAKNELRMNNPERIAILETTILNINATLLDLRQDMKRGFDRVDTKFDALEKKMDNKLDVLENKMDSKFDALETKVDSKFDTLQNRLWSNFLWLMGMIIGLAELIAHTQHWI